MLLQSHSGFECYYFGHSSWCLSDLSSSSYGLSLFSSKAGSHPGENVGDVVNLSSSVSTGELWPEIDQLDEVSPGDTSMTVAQNHGGDQALHSYLSCCEMGQMGANNFPKTRRVSSLLYVPPREPGGGSVKNKAT
jgi:hypothetical protein